MNFTYYLKTQLQAHPVFKPCDVVKLCFQATFGAAHILENENAKDELFKEYERANLSDLTLFEPISSKYARVNLGALKRDNLPCDWLWSMLKSSGFPKGNEERFLFFLSEASALLEGESKVKFEEYKREYLSDGIRPISHSEEYKRAYSPSYRVVEKRFAILEPILKSLAAYTSASAPTVIAIDGRAGAGKTTTANLLSEVLGVDVIRMDHFFLPPKLRSTERLLTAGGNVHYERFISEVIPNLKKPDGFCYGKFDCSKMAITGDAAIFASPYRIVEGSYAHHPSFLNYADVTVFVDVDEDEQLKRIIKRNGKVMAKTFKERWIPMEEKYFKAFDVEKKAEILIHPIIEE